MTRFVGIHPVIGRNLHARTERHQHAAGHVLLGQPQFRGQDAVDVQAEVRPVRHLVQVDVGNARDLGHLLLQLAGHGQVAAVDSDHLHVDGGGQAEVEDLAGDVRRLEEERALREAFRQLAPQAGDIVRRGPVLRLQPHQDFPVGRR